MGSFEKLGILVIVVIIVMILAVAIHQWGGAADAGQQGVSMILVDPVEDDAGVDRSLDEADSWGGGSDSTRGRPDGAERGPDGATWSGGVPRSYRVREGDSLWVLVVERWRLKESFVEEIRRANPGLDPSHLRVGQELIVPDPAAVGAVRDAGAADDGRSGSGRTIRYEVQEGDLLESIARRYLGARWRWPKIVDANPGLDPKRLRVGREIVIPLD